MENNDGLDLRLLVPKTSEAVRQKTRDYARRLRDPKERDAARGARRA